MTSFPTPDHQRMYHLYRYLLTCLAMTRKKDGSPNYQAISKRLSDRNDFRKIVSELLKSSDESITAPLRWNAIASVTTGNIVTLLARLQQQLNTDYQAQDDQTPYTRILTQDDVLLVLHKIIELTPSERKLLGLGSSDNFTLLQRAFLAIQQSGGVNNHAVVFQLYRAAVGLKDADRTRFKSLDEVDQYIQITVGQILAYLPPRMNRNRDGQSYSATEMIKTELTQKAQRELRRLLARSGNSNQPGYRFDQMSSGLVNVESYIHHYLDRAFVKKLAQTVVENERLTDQFPVYLKRVVIQASGPLPFGDKRLGILAADIHYVDLLHPDLQRIDQQATVSQYGGLPSPGDYELASQDATRVTLEFYVKVPDGYSPSVGRVFQQLASEHGDTCKAQVNQRIDFSVDSRGIGGALSHAVKIINTALLWDLPCLHEYFSIAHDVTSTQDIIRDNVPSPVWAHNVVKLCRKETVAEALLACQRDRLRSYEEFAFGEPVGQGDYCGFDFFRAQSHAALQARLQAIRHTGVNPTEYIHDLCHHAEERIALENAWSYFKGYPFSSLAMVGSLEAELLGPKVGDRPLALSDPYICFDACLSIIEAFLDEGSYRLARTYLNRVMVLDEMVHHGLAIADHNASTTTAPHPIFSGQLQIRYLICLAHYYYLYDTSDTDRDYLPPDCNPDVNREVLVQRAWTKLDQAQRLIQVRLRKYIIINEVSQATFHPHYYLLSRIAFLQAKLLLFFSPFVPQQSTLLTEHFMGQQRIQSSRHWGQLYLAEKARLYAAADGHSEVYVCYAAMQCWLHLIAAYGDPSDLRLPTPLNAPDLHPSQTLSPQECMDWAERLRDHALISYADVGRHCYYQIKEKSGLPRHTPPQAFGRYHIEGLPAIYEARGDEYDRLYQQLSAIGEDLWVWDMSLLKVDPKDLPKLSPNHPNHPIYLFGTNACYLFFARGLFLLCSDRATEFKAHHAAITSESSLLTRSQWDQKLKQATRLLNLAWSIAEEGCQIDGFQDDIQLTLDLTITRSLRRSNGPHGYYSPEVESVRDLYPRRINEIADLGKVFAAACIALRLYTLDAGAEAVQYEAQYEALRHRITVLLDSLHDTYHLSDARTMLLGQPRYNGHLERHLADIKALILDLVAQSQPAIPTHNPQTYDAIAIKALRDRLIKATFGATLD